MRRLKIAVILAAVLYVVTNGAIAQSKVPVFVDSTVSTGDEIGQLLVFELKEAIRGSQGYRLVDDSKLWPYIKFVVVTVKATVTGRSLGTAYGYTVLYDSPSMPLSGAFITSGAQVCPTGSAAQCARSNLADIDEAVSTLRRSSPELAKSFR